jgi:single-strand DNA-binding protein
MAQKLFLTNATLGKDPEIRETNTGKKVASFSVAVNEYYTQSGEKKKITDWFNCVAWDHHAVNAEKYLKKGSVINIVGKVKTRSYDDKDGNKKYVTEVLVGEMEFVSTGKKDEKPQEPQVSNVVDESDDLPF